MKTYKLGCRCNASAIVRRDGCFSLDVKDDPPGKFTFQTAYLEFGEERKLPGDLIVIVEAEAISISDAEKFANLAAFLTKIMAVGANAHFAPLEPEVIVETTAGIERRDFFQRLVQPGPPVLTGRFVSPEATIALMQAIMAHPDREIIGIAMNQYVLALSYWGIREELLVVSHLFMCAETMKRVVWRDILRREGISEEDLAVRWSWNPKREKSRRTFLDGYCREFEVLRGDRNVSKPAADISNAFEHGYENWNILYPQACEIVAPMARYLRDAILLVANPTSKALRILQSHQYEHPVGPKPIEFRLKGSIVGKGDHPAEKGNHLPMVSWGQAISAVEIDETRFSFTTNSQMTPSLATGFEFDEMQLTIEGPAAFNFTMKSDQGEPEEG